jgi:hypothetical protein
LTDEILPTTFQDPGMTFPFQVVAGEGAQPACEEKALADLGEEKQLEVVGEIFSAAAARGFDVEEARSCAPRCSVSPRRLADGAPARCPRRPV